MAKAGVPVEKLPAVKVIVAPERLVFERDPVAAAEESRRCLDRAEAAKARATIHALKLARVRQK